jgi:hypothetical protein
MAFQQVGPEWQQLVVKRTLAKQGLCEHATTLKLLFADGAASAAQRNACTGPSYGPMTALTPCKRLRRRQGQHLAAVCLFNTEQTHTAGWLICRPAQYCNVDAFCHYFENPAQTVTPHSSMIAKLKSKESAWHCQWQSTCESCQTPQATRSAAAKGQPHVETIYGPLGVGSVQCAPQRTSHTKLRNKIEKLEEEKPIYSLKKKKLYTKHNKNVHTGHAHHAERHKLRPSQRRDVNALRRSHFLLRIPQRVAQRQPPLRVRVADFHGLAAGGDQNVARAERLTIDHVLARCADEVHLHRAESLVISGWSLQGKVGC